MRRAAQALGIELNKLPARFSAPEKVSLAAVMKSATSVANGWLAEGLRTGAGPRASASSSAGSGWPVASRARKSSGICQESRHDPFFPALWVQGLDDPSVSPLENIKIYRAIVAKMGADRVAEFLRF